MYKVAFLSGSSPAISSAIQNTIMEINEKGGEIKQIVQSQSTGQSGMTIVTITIIYWKKY